MLRSFLRQGSSVSGKTIVLDPVESHHLVRVRRARAREAVEVLDGKGSTWSCALERADPGNAILDAAEQRMERPPSPKVILGQALLKGKAMDQVIQNATELGAARIVPLLTDHAEVRLNPKKLPDRLEKWRNLAIESCKQSGNPWLPGIAEPRSLEKFNMSLTGDTIRLIAALAEDARPFSALTDAMNAETIVWLIGPEGDFSETEYKLARESGFQSVTLGAHVLRAETAALAALAMTAMQVI